MNLLKSYGHNKRENINTQNQHNYERSNTTLLTHYKLILLHNQDNCTQVMTAERNPVYSVSLHLQLLLYNKVITYKMGIMIIGVCIFYVIV